MQQVVVLSSLFVLAFARTSLEEAVTRAFNEVVQEGSWAELFGIPGLTSASFCTGNSANYAWPEVRKNSDLDRVLQSGNLISGYPANVQMTAEGVSLIDTTGQVASGRVITFFDLVANKISSHYGTTVRISWDIHYTGSQDVLTSVQNGTFDAALGSWGLDATFTDSEEGVVPRVYAFSALTCPTYLEVVEIWTLSTSSVTSFSGLVSAINAGPYKLCTIGSPNGGTTQGCSNILSQYTNTPYTCIGEASEAFNKLATGACNAVWGGTGGVTTQSFASPSLATAGNLFRNCDVRGCECDGAGFVGVQLAALVAVLLFWVLQ